jgi:peptide/nickel transport system permease protein
VAIQLVLAHRRALVRALRSAGADIVARRLKGPSANALARHRPVRPRCAVPHPLRLRTSLIACLLAVGVALLIGGTLGLVAAYYRGWLDRIIMRVMDVLFAFPVMLLAIGIIAVLGPHTGSAAIAIAVVYTPIFARLLRGPALVSGESEYRGGRQSAIGASDARIIFLHILPNLASVILVQTSLLLSAAILVEASLSFLGLGTQPPTPSLGLMLSEGRNFLHALALERDLRRGSPS